MLLGADAFLREWLIHPYRQSDLEHVKSQQVIVAIAVPFSLNRASHERAA